MSGDRDSSYRALVRDVTLGTVAVIFLSLAVPAWIIRAEYHKTYGAPVKLTPTAEVLRETTSEGVIVKPRAPDILELTEQLVRREAERREVERREAARREAARREVEKREAERREAARREAERLKTAHSPNNTEVPVGPAAARPAQAVSPVVNTPQFDFRESMQSP